MSKMPIAVRDGPQLYKINSNYNSLDLRENTLEVNEDNSSTLNNIASLKNGVINVSKNNAKAPYTILLVGETGVGKSSVLELIANVLAGNDAGHYNFDILDHTNEQGGPTYQSQTNSARIYEFTSKNGVVVRILDTPGLADTGDLQQDELHKKNIAIQIQKHVDSINAVLVLANGTVPRGTVGPDYALSTLSTIFPQTFVNNTGFMFTNVSSLLDWNFAKESVPDVLRDAPHFLLNNPIALQKKYMKLMNVSSVKKRTHFRRTVKSAEQQALWVLVDLFDWLDGLEPQPTADVTSRYQRPLISTNQGTAKKETGPTGYTFVEGDSQVHQQTMQGTPEQMRGNLWFLKMAQKKVQEGVRKVMVCFTG